MKIAVITGTRAEYGLLKPIMRVVEQDEGLKLAVVVTGMHLSPEFGYTAAEIAADGWPVEAQVDMLLSNDSGGAMAKSLGVGIMGLTQALEQIRPDWVIVLGDRGEAFAGAVAAAHLQIPVAHYHGGDSARGGLDEAMRHSITKFAHIHFAATSLSAERIIKMGEEAWRVFRVGAPGLDDILSTPLVSEELVRNKFGIEPKANYFVVVQHPVSTQPESAASQMEATLQAVKDKGRRTVIVYPNSDQGGRAAIGVIVDYVNKFPEIFTAYKSIPREDYLSLLKYCSCLIGNSSSGMIESSCFRIPVVNVGTRQEGRERADNVIDAPHSRPAIGAAIDKALSDRDFDSRVLYCQNPYGNGDAAEKSVSILKTIRIDRKLLEKKLAY